MDIGYILTVIAVIFISMTLHEVMHGLIAHRLGDDTAHLMGRLTLNPLKHIDPFLTLALPLLIIFTNAVTGSNMPVFGGAKPVPFNPARVEHDEWGVALLAVAGPLVNLVIAFVAFGIMVSIGGTASGGLYEVLSVVIAVNLGFFAFNMLPIPPLDGSRVVYALAPDFVRRFMDSIERYGLIAVALLVMIASPLLGLYMRWAVSGLLVVFQSVFGI